MMRLIFSLTLLSCFVFVSAQKRDAVSSEKKHPRPAITKLTASLSRVKSDTARVNTYGKLVNACLDYVRDSIKTKDDVDQARLWASRQLELATKIHWNQGIAEALYNSASVEEHIRNLSKSRELLKTAEEVPANTFIKNRIAVLLASTYMDSQQYDKCRELAEKVLPALESSGDKTTLQRTYMMVVITHLIRGDFKGAVHYNLRDLATFKEADTSRDHVQALELLADVYQLSQQLPQALEKVQQAQQLQHGKKTGVETTNATMARIYSAMGNYAKALGLQKKIIDAAIAVKDTTAWWTAVGNAAVDAYQLGNYDESIRFFDQVLSFPGKVNDVGTYYDCYIGLAEDYCAKKNYSAAMQNIKLALAQAKIKANNYLGGMNTAPEVLGMMYVDAPDSVLVNASYKLSDRYQKATEIFEKAIKHARGIHLINLLPSLYLDLSRAYEKQSDEAKALDAYRNYIITKDSVDKLHDKNDVTRRETEFKFTRREDSIRYAQSLLSNQLRSQLKISNQQKNIDSLKYKETQAGLQAEQNRRQANEQKLKASQKERALAGAELELQKTEINSRRWQGYYMMGGIAALLLLSAFISRNYFNQRRSNKLISAANLALDQQRVEVTVQRDKLNDTIKDLKAAQQQLIQAEKMASLGELTAGIAHEIQNPLNFVNNFSDVNREMVVELKEALHAGDLEEAMAIAGDLEQNEEKINHHGKRADGIVKGMLEHSRTSTGQKQPTDLNKLADEYLPLAYHGLRAKGQNFSVELITHFDEKLPLVNVIPQETGRVLLNLFNNAFYAVQQKQLTAGTEYKPMIQVVTSVKGRNVQLAVIDNGVGIPDTIKEKIMQPFFTTKPTGQGTGLGLSLSYDIVVKGHGGSLVVNSTPGEGAEFIVQLPVNSI